MKIEDFLKTIPTDDTIEIKESVLRAVCTQLKEWEGIAKNYEERVKGLEELINALRVDLDSRKTRFIDLEV